MSSWAIVALVAIVIWGAVQIFTRRHDHKLGVTRDEDGNPVFPPREEESNTQQELEELRERVKVLEKITVDGREARLIADEIEQLRDKAD